MRRHGYKSVLKYVAGMKNNEHTIKIFLSYDDKDAKQYFVRQLPKNIILEFVYVDEKSKEMKRTNKTNVEYTSCSIETYERETLSHAITNQGEAIYAKFSSIIGFRIGKMFSEPCIILYCLDKDLVPFGEKPLPKFINGWPCDIKEDFVMFGACFDCRQINHPNPGCCIGIPSNGIGSVGFLVKQKGSSLETAGFLTAAHVAAENWTYLYQQNSFLSKIPRSDIAYQIAHPLQPNDTNYKYIGTVVESFCGNLGPDYTGIDAAFVQNYEPIKGGNKKLVIV